MAIGRVKWFNDVKGFGLIERLFGMGPAREVFVHYSGIVSGSSTSKSTGRKSLQMGEEVEFDLYESPKGLVAKNVLAKR